MWYAFGYSKHDNHTKQDKSLQRKSVDKHYCFLSGSHTARITLLHYTMHVCEI